MELQQVVAMGTAARKHPFSDLSDTDLAKYERRVRATRTLADVMREVESFTRTEHELSGTSSRPEGSSGSAPPRLRTASELRSGASQGLGL
jgi:hypothetical protein